MTFSQPSPSPSPSPSLLLKLRIRLWRENGQHVEQCGETMSWSEDISHTCHLDHLIGQFTLHIIVGFFVTLELFIQLTQGRIVESYSILPCVYCSEALAVSKSFFLLQIWIKNQTIKTRRQSNSPIVQFRIINYRWIQTLTTHSYRVSLDVK